MAQGKLKTKVRNCWGNTIKAESNWTPLLLWLLLLNLRSGFVEGKTAARRATDGNVPRFCATKCGRCPKGLAHLAAKPRKVFIQKLCGCLYLLFNQQRELKTFMRKHSFFHNLLFGVYSFGERVNIEQILTQSKLFGIMTMR